ncbi:unnamed protein product [Durusdinium trenchii]
MEFLAQLDAAVLSRTLSFLPQREAWSLTLLSSEWTVLVAQHLRRLTVSDGAARIPPPALRRAAPWLRRLDEVTFVGSTRSFWAFASELLELLQRHQAPLQRLTVRASTTDAAIPAGEGVELLFAVLRGGNDAGVESLTVEELVLRDELMEEVKCFMARNNLSSLALKQCGLEGAQAEKLLTLEGAQSEKLTHLDLSRNALGLEGANVLANWLPSLPTLQVLMLGGNALGPAGLATLVPALAPSLKILDLSLNGLGTTGIEALMPAELKLESLNLYGNWLGSTNAEVVPVLLQSMSDTLITLDLAQNKLGPRGLHDVLVNLRPLPRLRKLVLAENSFATEDFPPEAFSRLSVAAPQLEELDLRASQLGGDRRVLGGVIQALQKSLRILHLGAASLEGEALAVLLENLDLPLLENLSLVQARLVDSSLQVLGSWWSKGPSVPLPKLRSMDLSGNFVSSHLPSGACG